MRDVCRRRVLHIAHEASKACSWVLCNLKLRPPWTLAVNYIDFRFVALISTGWLSRACAARLSLHVGSRGSSGSGGSCAC